MNGCRLGHAGQFSGDTGSGAPICVSENDESNAYWKFTTIQWPQLKAVRATRFFLCAKDGIFHI